MTVTSGGLPPAGWYADPQVGGQQRWWTGTEWIEHTRDGAARQTFCCPECGSSETQTLRMIRAHGTGFSDSSGSAWVQNADGQGHRVSVSMRTTTQSAVARAAAPPRKRQDGVAFMGLGVVVGAAAYGLSRMMASGPSAGLAEVLSIYAIVGGLLVVLWGFVRFIQDIRHNATVTPEAHERWERSWQCARCGGVFEV